MRRALFHPTVAIAFVLTTTLATVPNRRAFAQATADSARRAQLIRQAEQADRAGDHVRALALAEQAAQISMSTSLRLFTTEQQLALGRVVEALSNAEACAQEAEANPQLVNRAVILAECRRHAQTLATRVGRLTIRAPSPAPPGLRVQLAGHDLDPSRFDTPQIVAPGTVVVDASANGATSLHREVAVAAGATVEVPIAFETAAPTPTASHAPIEASVRPPPPAAPPPEEHHTVLPFVVAGAGAAAFGASIAFFLLRTSTLNRLDMHCTLVAGVEHCDNTPSNTSDYSNAQTFASVSTIGWIAGVALFTGATVWWLFDHRHRSNERHAVVGIAPLAGGGMMQVGGAF